jgi:hypothetical protein
MTRSGRVRGRPRPPGRGARMPCSTGASWVLSWRCPAVMTTASGRPFPSHARWNLVVSPPRLRPSPSSAGWTIPFFRRPDCVVDGLRWRVGGHGRSSYPHSPPRPPPPPRLSASAHERGSDPTCCHVASDRAAPRRSATVRSARAKRQGAPVRSFHKMPVITWRWSRHWPPRLPYAGSSGAMAAQVVSVSSRVRPSCAPRSSLPNAQTRTGLTALASL